MLGVRIAAMLWHQQLDALDRYFLNAETIVDETVDQSLSINTVSP